MQSYRELVVWQRGIELVSEVYKLTERYPRSEMFGLTSQTRRAAVSIPANIAEGFARKHRQENIQFLRIAFGSGAELETHFEIAENLKFADPHQLKRAKTLIDEVMRMLNKLIGSLVAKN